MHCNALRIYVREREGERVCAEAKIIETHNTTSHYDVCKCAEWLYI